MILQVPIAFGYAPEERFIFTLDGEPIRQTFFYEECDIFASFADDLLHIDIVNEKLANPKITVSQPGSNSIKVEIKLSRGNANFYCKLVKELVEMLNTY